MIDKTLVAQAMAGDVYAQCLLGNIYARRSEKCQNSKSLNRRKAEFWYQKAAEEGYVPAFFLLGLHNDDTSSEPNYKKAAVWYRKAAELGDAQAQYRLAEMYEEGLGLKVDFAQAALWYRKAAEQGEPSAQYNLAHVYANGRGVKKNLEKAAYWLREAASHQGYDFSTDAERELAILLKTGLKDYTQAAVWFCRAAEHGDLEALVELADLYAVGLGVRQNAKQAIVRYRKAASFGNIRALVRLGESYAEGRGVRKSFADAFYCLTIAALELEGDERGITEKKAGMVAAHLTTTELSKAKQRVRRHIQHVNQREERRILKIQEMRTKRGGRFIPKPTRPKAIYRF